jgi:hypothetical protein
MATTTGRVFEGLPMEGHYDNYFNYSSLLSDYGIGKTKLTHSYSNPDSIPGF